MSIPVGSQLERPIANQRQISSLARAGQNVLNNYGGDIGSKNYYGPGYQAEKQTSPRNEPRGLTRLRYKVVAWSSEDPASPAEGIQVDYQNLLQNKPLSNPQGWSSQKFCSYPQELVLKFEAPLRLKTLNMLSHENKISSRIELFYIPYFDPKSQPDGPRKDQVCRIGHFSFEDIDRSAPKQMREMKTVHLSDIYTQFVKIDLYQPYEHPQNIF